jgi:hypothetical protein
LNSPAQDPPKVDLNSIDVGVGLVERKIEPDARDLLEAEKVKSEQLRNKLAHSQIKDRKSDRRLRKTYAGRILRYLETYSVVVGILLIMSGWHVFGFNLDKETEIALTGSTALAAIGLVGFIAKGLFKQSTGV